jgi:hypothetical protein
MQFSWSNEMSDYLMKTISGLSMKAEDTMSKKSPNGAFWTGSTSQPRVNNSLQSSARICIDNDEGRLAIAKLELEKILIQQRSTSSFLTDTYDGYQMDEHLMLQESFVNAKK